MVLKPGYRNTALIFTYVNDEINEMQTDYRLTLKNTIYRAFNNMIQNRYQR